MNLFKEVPNNKRVRTIQTLKLDIDEKPERPSYAFRSDREKVKFILMVESMVRKSNDYRELVQFVKTNMDMKKCLVLRGLNFSNGKKYSIEIHHEPFTLYDIVETVINAQTAEGKVMNPFMIADEVLSLHYEGMVGLIPLSITVHELVHDDQIFIPLQLVYQDYDKFYEEYHPFIPDNVKSKVEAKAGLSLKTGEILSDVLDPCFTYLDVDGFNFPEVPDEWKDIIGIRNQGKLPKEPKKKDKKNETSENESEPNEEEPSSEKGVA